MTGKCNGEFVEVLAIGRQLAQRCVVTLGPDTTLTEIPGYDDVTGIGAPTSTFITTLAKG